MAAEEVAAEPAAPLEGYIALTQSTLGQLISKPRLLPERLRKPPFRFLFDAVAEVARQTGFGAAELFGGDPGEKPAVPAARDDKVAFLDGWISLVAGVLGGQAEDLTRISSQDIVCGVHPEWTNYLLQCSAAAAWPNNVGAPPSPAQLDPAMAHWIDKKPVEAVAPEHTPVAEARQSAEAPLPAEAAAPPPEAAVEVQVEEAERPQEHAAPELTPVLPEISVSAVTAEEAVENDPSLQAAFQEFDQLQEEFATTFAQTAGAWRPGAGADGAAPDAGGEDAGDSSDSSDDEPEVAGAEGRRAPEMASTQVLRSAAATTSKIDGELQQALELMDMFEKALDQDEEEMAQRRERVQALRDQKEASARAEADAEEAERAEREAQKAARKAEKVARKARKAAAKEQQSAPPEEEAPPAPVHNFPVSQHARTHGARIIASSFVESAVEGEAVAGQSLGEASPASAEPAEAPPPPPVVEDGDLGGMLDAMMAGDQTAAAAPSAAPAGGLATGSQPEVEGPLFERLKAELKETFISYLCATMPEALIRKHHHDELIGCLQLLLQELRKCLEQHGLEDVQDEDATDLAEELRMNFPNDWLAHLQGASPWALRQKYKMYELIDTLQGLASTCHDRLTDERGPTASRWAPEDSPLRCPPDSPAPAAKPAPAPARAVSPSPPPTAQASASSRQAPAARTKPWEAFGQSNPQPSQASSRLRAAAPAPAPAFDATLGPASWEVQEAQGPKTAMGPRTAGGGGFGTAGAGTSAGARPRTQYHSHALASR